MVGGSAPSIAGCPAAPPTCDNQKHLQNIAKCLLWGGSFSPRRSSGNNWSREPRDLPDYQGCLRVPGSGVTVSSILFGKFLPLHVLSLPALSPPQGCSLPPAGFTPSPETAHSLQAICPNFLHGKNQPTLSLNTNSRALPWPC